MRKIIYIGLFAVMHSMQAAYTTAARRVGSLIQSPSAGFAPKTPFSSRAASEMSTSRSLLAPIQRALLSSPSAMRQARTLLSPAFRYQCQDKMYSVLPVEGRSSFESAWQQRFLSNSPAARSSGSRDVWLPNIVITNSGIASSADLVSSLERFEHAMPYEILGLTWSADMHEWHKPSNRERALTKAAYLRARYSPDKYSGTDKEIAEKIYNKLNHIYNLVYLGGDMGFNNRPFSVYTDQEIREHKIEDEELRKNAEVSPFTGRIPVWDGLSTMWVGGYQRDRSRSSEIHKAVEKFNERASKHSFWGKRQQSDDDKAIEVMINYAWSGRNKVESWEMQDAYDTLSSVIDAYRKSKKPWNIEDFVLDDNKYWLRDDKLSQMMVAGYLHGEIKREIARQAAKQSNSGWSFRWPWSKK